MSQQNNQSRERSDQEQESHQSQLASIGQVAAGIAHEIRNPLTAVKGFLQLIKEESSGHYVEIAQSELENALATLENLLQLSKPEAETEPYDSFNLSTELDSILNLFLDQQYRVEIKKEWHDPHTRIYGRKNQLKKAFFNLLKNAFEAIPEKGMISVGQFVADGQVHIVIEDTGVGFPEDKLSMIGTPFFTTKENGTGMGLTQVVSAIHQHGGRIKIDSRENEGTRFHISLPVERTKKQRGVIKMNFELTDNESLREFLLNNHDRFEERLLAEAVNVKDKIDEIHRIGNIDLVSNAHKLVLYVVEEREHELMLFAQEEGRAWARHDITIAFKLEWLQSIRRVLWDFLYNFDRVQGHTENVDKFYELEKKVNTLLDQFLSHFFISYTQYKDEILKSQRELIEDLSVPFIPLTASMSILPLVGTIDSHRMRALEEKVLDQIAELKINTLIIDFSGVTITDVSVLERLVKVLDGINLMGCKAVITGMRPEIVKSLINRGMPFKNKAETKGTLQQALKDYLVPRVQS